MGSKGGSSDLEMALPQFEYLTSVNSDKKPFFKTLQFILSMYNVRFSKR